MQNIKFMRNQEITELIRRFLWKDRLHKSYWHLILDLEVSQNTISGI